MNYKPLLLVLLCWLVGCATTEKKPARNYKMVNEKNGLLCRLLDVGPTSIVIRAEWPLDRPILPYHWVYLKGKRSLREKDWQSIGFMDVEREQGWAEQEFQLDGFMWDDWENPSIPEKAYFKLEIPEVPEGWWGEAAEEEEVGEPPDSPPSRYYSPDDPPDAAIEVYMEVDGVGGTEMRPVLSGLLYLITLYTELDEALLFGDDPSTNIVYRWKVAVPGGETHYGCTDLYAIRDTLPPEVKENYKGHYLLDFFLVKVPYIPRPPAPLPEPTEDDGKAVGEIP